MATKTPRKITDGPQRKWVQAAPTVLATLTASEQRAVRTASTLVNTKAQELNVMRAGLNAVWAEIRAAHDLPAQFAYNPETGEVTRGG